MRTLATLSAVYLIALVGCSGSTPEAVETRIVVEVKGLGGSPADEWAGLAPADAKEAAENVDVAFKELDRIVSENDKSRTIRGTATQEKLTDEYYKRREADKLAASRWFRQQVEGKSPGDLVGIVER